MPVKPAHRPIMNPVRPGTPTPAPKLPNAKQLKNVLGTYAFQSIGHEVKWSTKKPAGEVLKSVTVEKAPKAPQTGSSITAYFLKSDPTKVYFEKAGSIAPHYYGPVSWTTLPKGLPGPILNPIRPG